MRNYLLAAAAVAALATPAMARDGQPYVGIEGGVLFPKDNAAGDIFVDYTSTQTPAVSATVPSAAAFFPADTTTDGGLGLDYGRRGSDFDIVAGYDFGFIRLEAELARKRARLEETGVDAAFLTALNTGLNRPSAAPDVGAPGLPAITDVEFGLDGSVKVRSLMVNALLDFGNDDGLSFYAGGGAGRADVKYGDVRDGAWAFQGIAGVRYALTRSIDLGLKYRYFRTGKVDLSNATTQFLGNSNQVIVNPTTTPVTVNVTTNAVLFSEFETKFRSHSLLASLIFNFGGVAPPPPPPVVIAPPPPPPPATQTCPDGSVILATEVCPAPPAPPVYVPPPAPEPAPERG